MPKLSFNPERALLAQMDFHQGSVTRREGFHEALIIVEGRGDIYIILDAERLIDRAVKGEALQFGTASPKSRLAQLRLKKEFILVRAVLERCSACIQYGPRMTVFFSIARELGLFQQPLTEPGAMWTPISAEQAEQGFKSHWEVYDELLRRVGAAASKASVQAEVRRWRNQAEADFQSASEYVAACFKVSPGLFVLRMNLGLWQPLLEGRLVSPGPDQVMAIKAAFAKLTKQLCQPRFSAIVGHMARLDYGAGKGYFMHMVVFLKVAEASNAIDWCHRLGEMWEQLSPPGMGAYTGCNWVFGEFELTQGPNVGLVDGRRPADRLTVERWVLPYVTLASRYRRVKMKPRERAFFRGTMPQQKVATSPAGSPERGRGRRSKGRGSDVAEDPGVQA